MAGVSTETLRKLCLESLWAVGDDSHQWEEMPRHVYHIRRRLSAIEQAQVGPAVDYRGTDEGPKRFAAMEIFMNPELRQFALEELNHLHVVGGTER
jgi:hypothetical protein